MPRENQNVVWAVDPFPAKDMPVAKARHLLAAIERDFPISVEPVAVVSSREARWPLEPGERWTLKFVEIAENSLRKVNRRLRMPDVREPTVLVENSNNRAREISALLHFAESQNAKFVLLNLHSREGFRRFRIGGFAEALFGVSKFPVFTVRSNTRVPNRVRTILFASALTENSAAQFSRLVDIAKSFAAKILLMHRLEVPVIFSGDWVGFASAGEAEAMQEAMRESEGIKRAKGEELIRFARGEGVEAALVVQRGMAPLGQSILKCAAESKADIVSIATGEHSLTEKILGTTSREVLRFSPRPVLVIPA